MVYHPSVESMLYEDQPATADFESESERVARMLREEIIDGRRTPGSRLVERDLAAEMGVSRIPVRDALRELVAEGLVTPRPRTWAVVRTFTQTDVEELIEVRSALEVLAFRRAAVVGTAEQLAALRRCLATEQRAAAAGDVDAARHAGIDFHEAVVAMAGNALLGELFGVTRSRMRWLLAQHSDLAPMAEEHAGLYQALADHDPDRAAALAQDHLVTSRSAALAQRSTPR
jgi:DNA-binding GntR family transcriptional regulator